MKRITASALALSFGIAVAGWTGPALAAKHNDQAARAWQAEQRHAWEAQQRAAAEWQRAQARQGEFAHRHAFERGRYAWGGRLNAWQACAMFFGRC